MIKRNLLILIPVVLLSFIIVLFHLGCESEKIVAEIGGEKITLKDFKEKFLKKNGYNVEVARSKSPENRNAFLNELINIELKAKIGKEKELDTSESFKNDMRLGERKLLSDIYLNNKLVEPNLKSYYDKINYDVRASHILLPFEKGTEVQDSVKIYFLASEIIKRLSENQSFDSLARMYSTDADSRERGGDLYYFSPGMTVSDFEYAVYNLKPGEFTTEPVRTPLGLHIIKLTDKQERYDSVKISHILIKDEFNQSGQKDSVASYNKIKEVYDKLNDGEEFEKLAEQYSNDTINKSKGGDLGYIKRRQFTFAFDSTIFSLRPGQISGIIRTEYGWHILKMTDAVKMKPFDEIKDMLSVQYPMSVYFRKDYQKLIPELRIKYDLNVDESGLNFLMSKIKDTTLAFIVLNPNKLFSEDDKKAVIAKYNGGEVTVNDLIIYVSTNSAAANWELTRVNTVNLILSSADEILFAKESVIESFDKSEKYLKSVEEYKKYLLSESVNKNLITPEIKISENDIQDYYNNNKNEFKSYINGVLKEKDLNQVRDDIITALKNSKFIETENLFLDNLKIKYNVSVNYSVLEDLFK